MVVKRLKKIFSLKHFILIILGFNLNNAIMAAPDNSSEYIFQSLESSHHIRLGIAAINTANDDIINYRANERFPFCSTVKVMVAAAILKASEKNSELLNHVIHYTHADVENSGYGPITNSHVKTGMSIGTLCKAMLNYSDSTAMNLLVNFLGGTKAINQYARSISDEKFMLNRMEPELNTAIPNDKRDTTTPLAMMQSLKNLTLGDTLASPQRMILIQWLKDNTTGNERIRAGVPKNWVVGDKTGTGNYGTTNDIAIIYPPHCAPIIIAIYLTSNLKSAMPNNAMIASATKEIISEFSKTDTCLKLNFSN